jgi:hypothetical protein
MAIRFGANLGMHLLALWLILTGLAGLVVLPLPWPVMPLLALLAGILIYFRR